MAENIEENKNTEEIGTQTENSAAENSEEKKEKSIGREIFEWVYSIVIAIVIAFLIKGFVFDLVKVEGGSMDSTLADGQRLIVTELGYKNRARNGDIIILDSTYKNREAFLSHYSGMEKLIKRFSLPAEYKKKYYVKRIIATEGQTVEITDGKVFVDGNELSEDYIQGVTYAPTADYKVTVDEGCVFVMGDNREHSSDSRNPVVGQIPTKAILGKAQFRLFPFSKWGSVYN